MSKKATTGIFALRQYEVKSDQENSAAQGDFFNFPLCPLIQAKSELSGLVYWVLTLV